MRMLTKATDKSTPIDLNQDLLNKQKYAETLQAKKKKANIIVLTKMPEPVPNTAVGKPSFDNTRTSVAG